MHCPVELAMAVRAQHIALGNLGQDLDLRHLPLHGLADIEELCLRIAVVEVKAGGMILTALLTFQANLDLEKP
jgi:hypothetical protein